ncbi:MAG: hypothetical protein JWQ10_1877 [Herbaspirillum sp.]|jgi:hypothetical protein|nr:hypothetical protein [Herbaspirillum sp.]
MNNITWKWILAANCLIASSASFAAGSAAGGSAGLRNSIGDPIQQPKSIPLDKSKFRYMDSAPIYNTHHVRAAVMIFERKPDKQNQCTALKGKAKHHCYELAMPT